VWHEFQPIGTLREDRISMSAPHLHDQQWWQHHRFGLFLHANLASVPAWAPVGQYADWYRAHLDGASSDTLLHPSPMVETIAHHRDRWDHVAEYDDFAQFLTFDEFDADEWVALAGAAGMSYTVMLAKHHDGLCWWDAPGTDRTVLALGPRRNVLAEYADACPRAGLEFGTSYSLLDWGDARYPTPAYVEQAVHPQVLDLVERYGTRLMWGDGHWGGGGEHWQSDRLVSAARALDPSIVVNDRWWWDGATVRTFEYRIPEEIRAEPWELRRGLGASFGHNRSEPLDSLLKPSALIAVLTEVIAKGGHLLLSVGADAAGRIPTGRADSLVAAGAWVKTHRQLVERGMPWTTWGDRECRYLVLDGTLHAVDLTGKGRFGALSRGAGRVIGVEAVGSSRALDVEQDGDGLRIVRRDRGAPGTAPLGIEVYRIELEPLPSAPIELFPSSPAATLDLAQAVAGARRGQIVQLGDGVYTGPAHVPEGVTLRGLGPHRTTLEGNETHAVTLAAGARLEHCTVRGGGVRIVWLPKVAAVLAGAGSSVLGCTVDGHVQIDAGDCRVTSSTLTGVIAAGVDHVTVVRSTFKGTNWDCAIEISEGGGHLIESCEVGNVLEAVRLTATTGATVRGNRVRARWWGVRAVDTQGTLVVGNAFTSITRAVDIDGGTLAEVTGNAVTDGDSGCVVQRGASSATVTGNRWERTRIGLLAWDSAPVKHHDNTAVDLIEPDRSVTVGP
jgi:alpha-L-fucosidase